jgi:hypothetical protein
LLGLFFLALLPVLVAAGERNGPALLVQFQFERAVPIFSFFENIMVHEAPKENLADVLSSFKFNLEVGLPFGAWRIDILYLNFLKQELASRIWTGR